MWLFSLLLALAGTNPEAALDRAPELHAAPWRERVEREAFFALAVKDPRAAHKRIGTVIDRPWMSDLPFGLVLEQAYALPEKDGRALLLRAARMQPEAALREAATCLRFPYGREVLTAAIEEAPGEAAALAGKVEALDGLVRFRDPATAAFLMRGREVREPRLAALLDAYREEPTVYWRRAVSADAAEFLRVLHQKGLGRLDELNAAQRMTLASLARTEEEEEVAPALLAKADLPEGLLRRVMAFAVRAGRFAQFDEKELVQRACSKIASLTEAMEAADILGATKHKVVLGDSDFERILAKPGKAGPLALGTDIVERFVFPNDGDGVDSFASFRAAYVGDREWKWTEEAGVVNITAKGIRIFANVPEEGLENLQVELPREADVIVHRGHDYHVPRTLPFIPSKAKLVFLGSCKGTLALEQVGQAAPAAQIVATRGIGTKEVNDPFLKMMNRYLLHHAGRLEWPALWKELQANLSGNEHFRNYVAPPDNAAANFLMRWNAYLASL